MDVYLFQRLLHYNLTMISEGLPAVILVCHQHTNAQSSRRHITIWCESDRNA